MEANVFLLLAAPSALALDCATRDPVLCPAVDDAITRANAELPVPAIVPGATSPRLRPGNVYAQITALQEVIQDNGCRTDDGFDGWEGGRYQNPLWTGTGSWDGVETTVLDGVYATSTRTFDGEMEPSGGGIVSVGASFSGYGNTGRYVGSLDDGFIAGVWLRQAGNRGLFVGLHGTCDSGVDPADALEPWVGEPITRHTTAVRIDGTADDNFELFVDGVLMAPTSGAWQQVTSVTVDLTPGTHTVAVRAVNNGTPSNGNPGMMQLRAIVDGTSNTLLVSEVSSAWRAFDALGGEPASWQDPSFDDSGWGGTFFCSEPGGAPWNQNPVGDPAAKFIWQGTGCRAGSTPRVLFRADLVVP